MQEVVVRPAVMPHEDGDDGVDVRVLRVRLEITRIRLMYRDSVAEALAADCLIGEATASSAMSSPMHSISG